MVKGKFISKMEKGLSETQSRVAFTTSRILGLEREYNEFYIRQNFSAIFDRTVEVLK